MIARVPSYVMGNNCIGGGFDDIQIRLVFFGNGMLFTFPYQICGFRRAETVLCLPAVLRNIR